LTGEVSCFSKVAGVMALLVCAAACLLGQAREPDAATVQAGELVYKSACIACHGANGKGTPRSTSGFKRPDSFPDFTRCDQTTAEADSDWKALIVYGGPFRGFSQIMPSFGEALSAEEIDQVISYLRAFCRNSHWPRGELNMPRALVTEKAYPED
jgi:mono/diheme cytochrome c family protein